MNEHAFRALSDANLAESHREFARWHPEGEILERQDLLLTRGADRYAGVNFAMRTGVVHVPPQQVVERALAFFRARADGFAVRARGHLDQDLVAHCERLDWMSAGENIGLMRRTPLPAVDPAVRISLTKDLTAAETFAELATSAFATIGLPRATANRIFEDAARMVSPHLLGLIGHLGEQPASVALVLLSHGVAGLYWVGTAPWARGRGLARAVVTAAHNRALQQGARAVMLQANTRHASFYTHLGYRAIARYPWFFAGGFPQAATAPGVAG